MMRIPLDPHEVLPLYRQIEQFIREGIQSGNLAPDTRLPASRQLAKDLGVSRITVENAYAELKADGLIISRNGSGTYVLHPCPLPVRREQSIPPWPLWQEALQAERDRLRQRQPDEMLKAAGHPHPISFADGNGDPRLFPVEDFRRAVQTVVHRDGITALEYGDPCGFLPLRTTIAHILTSQGLPSRSEQILITSGSQQALGLVAQCLLKAGDTILVESPTYAKALELFNTLGLKVIGIPVDGEGMQVEQLEELLQQYHPKLIYTIPNFQNPTGTCLSSWRRRQLVDLANRYNVPILEDDFVGDLRYEGRAQPALKALDPGGRVIYTSTFSKMLLPGVRIGFVVAEGPVYEELAHRKSLQDLATSNLIQRALEDYVTVGRYEAHLRRSCQVYRKRRDTMLRALKRYLPADVRVITPNGGLFMWVQCPVPVSAEALLPLACAEGVAFMPGKRFFPNPSEGEYYLRLNFATHVPAEIEEGIQRMGVAWKRYLR